MNPIPFYIIPRTIVESLTRRSPVPSELLITYLSCRPGILDDSGTDIFMPNCRSADQQWKRFDLFERWECVFRGVVVVFPFWLELFLSGGVRQNIKLCVDWALQKFPYSPIIFQWNHDTDCATIPELQNLPERVFVIQFNTSKPTRNDILVPFWAINTNHQPVPKKFKAGFCGYVGSIPVRQKLQKLLAYRDIPGFYFSRDRIPEDVWLNLVGSFWYSLCPRGGGLSSYRFYESIQCGSIPVLISDAAVLPYPDLDWRQFSVRVKEADVQNIVEIIESMMGQLVLDLQMKYLQEARPRFSLGGVQEEIYRRLSEYLK